MNTERMLVFTNQNKMIVIVPEHKGRVRPKIDFKIFVQKAISRIIIFLIAILTFILFPLLLSLALRMIIPEDTPLFTMALVLITLCSCAIQLIAYYILIDIIDDRIDPWWK